MSVSLELRRGIQAEDVNLVITSVRHEAMGWKMAAREEIKMRKRRRRKRT